MKNFTGVAIAGLAILLVADIEFQIRAADNPPAADPAASVWAEVEQAAVLPKPPAAWQTQPPTDAQEESFRNQTSAAATAAAEKARDYCARFPDSTNLLAAKTLACKMWETAYNMTGDQKLLPAVLSAEHQLLADSKLTDDGRFDARVKMVRFQAQAKEFETSGDWTNKWSAYEAENERQIRALIKDYPHREKPYMMLVNFGANADDAKARAIATEVLDLPVSSNVLANAQGVLRRVNAVGQPPEIQFTAVDGRAVDVSQMKGRVVLVDFWATWCGPCVGEIPNVQAVYKKLHAQGFEVVGISFDGDQKELERFVKKQALPWPQYFDGRVWNNKFGVQYGIKGIPAMWLVDKQGNVRDQNARQDLLAKVEKLLAE